MAAGLNFRNTQRSNDEMAHAQHTEVEPVRTHANSNAYHNVTRDLGSIGHCLEDQWLETPTNEWLSRQCLENDYRAHERRSARMVNPVAQRAVLGMDITRFVQPTNSASRISAPSTADDLGYSLRNFLAVNPVCDPNVVYARIAVREGRTQVGYVPPMPQPRCMKTESEVEESSETCGGR